MRAQPLRCNPGEAPPRRPQERRQEAATGLGGCACPGQGQGSRGNRVPRLGISLSFAPGKEPVPRELSRHHTRSFSPCGTLRSQPAGHFPTVRGKARSGLWSVPPSAYYRWISLSRHKTLTGFERRANAELRGAAKLTRLRVFAGGWGRYT